MSDDELELLTRRDEFCTGCCATPISYRLTLHALLVLAAQRAERAADGGGEVMPQAQRS